MIGQDASQPEAVTKKLSVSRLLGGRHVEALKPYASMLFSWPVTEMSKNLESGVERKFRAFKLGWGPFGREDRKKDEALVKAARKVVRDGSDLMVGARPALRERSPPRTAPGAGWYSRHDL